MFKNLRDCFVWGPLNPLLSLHFPFAQVANFKVHLKMGSGGKRNRLFSDLLKVENDENVEGDFDDARETPGSVIPVNPKSSK